eukprot:CAMPEP_0194279566 /NCGR_PEP_ID=MMETSP0169-20130528/14003_1 /TAXON_ID=218684 /ORGANISM="Corethron pennatum, Strain L29A3" /LENGTH=193 /DNA_ID=CAMNT_0039024011 /DNA_START=119 /DNA_END=700 /DNA_ORIENTATION=+
MVESVTVVAVATAYLAYEAKNRADAEAHSEMRRVTTIAIDELEAEVLLTPRTAREDFGPCHTVGGDVFAFDGDIADKDADILCPQDTGSLRETNLSLIEPTRTADECFRYNLQAATKEKYAPCIPANEMNDRPKEEIFLPNDFSTESFSSCEPRMPDDLALSKLDHVAIVEKITKERDTSFWRIFTDCMGHIH